MNMIKLVLTLLIIGTMALPVTAQSPLSGAELFADRSLGTNGKSCADCHPQGKGLEEISSYADEMLSEMINFCIRDALKGTMFPKNAPELSKMRSYLRSL